MNGNSELFDGDGTRKDREEYVPMELLEVLPFQNAREDPGVIAQMIEQNVEAEPVARFKTLKEFVTDMQQYVCTCFCVIALAWNLDVDGFMTNLAELAGNFGLNMNVVQEPGRKSVGDLPQLFKDFQEKKVNLAIFIINGNAEYPHIKRQGDLYNFMFTQCIKRETISKENVLKNLILKINAKMGGTNWLVDGLSERLENKLVMVVGADVTHPGPNTASWGFAKSVAAVVASISSDLMRYVAIVRQQDQMEEGKTTREEIDGMEGIFSDLLKTYKRCNNSLPDKVIVYRDGVSEGQFNRVLRYELEAMKVACCRLDSRPIPITFIVVQKRHHIRFRPLQGARNVLPGTVIDKEVTQKNDSDFYLCSHKGMKGTSKPAHYHILYDDNRWNADDLQQFTYGLCHAYMRCSHGVSYPAPTYYSHLAAFRARE
ncbi:unnamed protein product, partial [Taenia asiatica]|uniref:Piwi domain-containing protein n=1 Tax=Taenia asiatica TaxID=60517 RepID=A0A0R3VZ01_TAEAS